MDFAGLPITLVVKAPNQKIADQTVECELDWNVKKLKRHLSSVYPSSPGENHQKIIYSGRLLEDDLVLKDVLRQYEPNQKTHIVHLVCSQLHEEYANSCAQRDTNQHGSGNMSNELRHRQRSAPNNPSNTADLSSVSAPGEFPTTDPTQLSHGNYWFGNTEALTGNVPLPLMPGMMYSPEQILWMQQMYTQQMTQYMQYYQAGTTVGSEHFVPTQVPPQPGNVGEPAAPNNRVRPPAAQQVRMNAQGGGWVDDDDDEEAANRDWLDWVYTFSRFSVLLSIVYFYSTISRFILVFGFFALVYLYQSGWLRGRRQQQPPEVENVQEVQPEPEVPDPAPTEPNPPDNEAESESSTVEEPIDENSEAIVPPPPGRIAVVWAFVSTFITSLVPQQPAAVNAN